jgi:hypothetical protein
MTRKSCLLLLLALAGPGCLNPGAHVEAEARKTPPIQMTEAPPPPPPVVTPDQVTDTNAVEAAQALSRELDQAANERPAALATTGTRESATKP